MFPLPIFTWIKIGIVAIALAGSAWLGYSFEHSRFIKYKADQAIQTANIEKEQQAQADQIRKTKDEQIANINDKLALALIELRKRPSRAEQASHGQSGTGLSLSAEDSSFLVWEAARADRLRTALDACYKQYDSLK